ncbi:MAG: gliding motility-associated C-terminal domain-containing protein [Crocinitomicaceae bacterium]
MEKDHFESLIKEKMMNHEMPVDTFLWNSVSANSGLAQTGLTVGLKALYIAASVLATIALSVYFYTSNNTPSTPSQKTTPTPTNEHRALPSAPKISVETANISHKKAEQTAVNNQLPLTEQPEATTVLEIVPGTEQKSNEIAVVHNGEASIANTKPTMELPEPINTNNTTPKYLSPKSSQIISSEAEESLVTTNSEAFVLPNTFTPNGDGINDELTLWLNGLEDISFVILDRNNRVVFSSTQSKVFWDGRLQNGDPAPSGTYQYFFTGKDASGRWINKQSTLTIIR